MYVSQDSWFVLHKKAYIFAEIAGINTLDSGPLIPVFYILTTIVLNYQALALL